MNTIDPLVSALIALCKAEGGEKFVADKAVVSAEYLLQITKGVKLPSGNPRGVGPGIREKITKAYPNWLDVPTHTASQKGVQVERRTKNASLSDILADLAAYLEQLDADDRTEAMKMMVVLADKPDRHSKVAASIESMVAATFAQGHKKSA